MIYTPACFLNTIIMGCDENSSKWTLLEATTHIYVSIKLYMTKKVVIMCYWHIANAGRL